MTLTRSYTTRRSQPMMRSRFRRPTSKSITAVLWPRSASPLAKLALVVVLPTPPLPEVTTTVLVIASPSKELLLLEGIEHQPVSLGIRYQPHLRRLAPYRRELRRFAGPIQAGDGNQLRLHPEREDPRIGIPARPRDGAAAQRRIHVDVPVRDHLRAGVHHGEHHQVSPPRVDLLARAQGLLDHERAGRCRNMHNSLGIGSAGRRRCADARVWRRKKAGGLCDGRDLAPCPVDRDGR